MVESNTFSLVSTICPVFINTTQRQRWWITSLMWNMSKPIRVTLLTAPSRNCQKVLLILLVSANQRFKGSCLGLLAMVKLPVFWFYGSEICMYTTKSIITLISTPQNFTSHISFSITCAICVNITLSPAISSNESDRTRRNKESGITLWINPIAMSCKCSANGGFT